jgi:hypothetical protein
MAAKTTGEQRNAKGECYITPCGKSAKVTIEYYGKSVKVCTGHKDIGKFT